MKTGQSASAVLNDVRSDATAQGLRNTNDADLVCLVTDHMIAAYGSTAGIAFTGGSGNPTSNFSGYSMIRLFASLGDMLFSHEGGHNMGCGHEAADNSSTNIDHAWEWTWSTGWWFWKKDHRRQSIMWSSTNSSELAAHYSNPNVNNNGQATGSSTANNAQILRNNACTVAAYRGATNNLMASISGPTVACPLETVCFFANVSGAPGPYSYQWAWTTNGFSYTNFGTGASACLSMFGNFFPPQLITIRLTVTASGQTVTTYHDVNLIESDAILCPQFKAQVGGVIAGADASLNVGPNPADVRTTATLYLPEDAPTKVGLYDLSGMLIRELTNETLEAGTHAIQIDLSTVPAGVYLLQATSTKYKLSKRLVVLN